MLPPSRTQPLNAHIDLIPTEIWIEILQRSLNEVAIEPPLPYTVSRQEPSGHNKKIDSRAEHWQARFGDPTRLSHVCGLWRSMLLDMPQLWARIVVSGPRTPSAEQAALWLERSRNMSITLELNVPPRASPLPGNEILQNLAQVLKDVTRLEAIKIHAPIPYAAFFGAAGMVYPSLRRADIHFYEDESTPDSQREPGVIDAWKKLTSAADRHQGTSVIRWTKRLPVRALATGILNPNPLLGFWTNVRGLHLSYGLSEAAALSELDYLDLLHLLEKWGGWLEELEISFRFVDVVFQGVAGGGGGVVVPWRAVTLPVLRRLVVRGPEGRETGVCLGNLTLPKLEELEIWHGCLSDGVRSDRPFSLEKELKLVVPGVLGLMLDRSGCELRSFVYVDENMSDIAKMELVLKPEA